MRILILGAGAIGGYFGAHLVRGGHNVTFLVRARRAETLRAVGLQIRSPLGSFSAAVTVAEHGNAMAPFDVVLVSCKAYDLDDAVASIEPAVQPGTLIVPLLNGTRHLEVLARRFPNAVSGALSHLSVKLCDDGAVEQLTPHAVIRVGGLHTRDQGKVRERLAPLVATWRQAGIDSVLSDNIATEMWAKHIFIATLAAATCLMRAPVGAVLGGRGGEAFIHRLFKEAVAVGTRVAPGVRPEHVEGYEAALLQSGSTVKASMARDVDRGARTEADHIIGDLVRLGAEHGIATPLLSLALLNLDAYDAVRSAIMPRARS